MIFGVVESREVVNSYRCADVRCCDDEEKRFSVSRFRGSIDFYNISITLNLRKSVQEKYAHFY
jgi:hypothetical protein